MQECFSSYRGSYITSKSAKYKDSSIEFSDVVLKKNNKTYHKFKYKI